MNWPISRSSAALLLLGTVAILLIGAFGHFSSNIPAAVPTAVAADTPAVPADEPAAEPQLPANLSPGLSEIIKLAQNHVDESVILAFIRSSSQTYSPTADEILYLTDLGLSQRVIAALFKETPPPAPQTTASATVVADMPSEAPVELPNPTNPPVTAQEVNSGDFHKALAPYGTWLQLPNYGACWQPTTETVNPDWRPYVDQGQWLYTDNGWYWQSGYSWGGIAFHYGRWTRANRFGWVWVPDNVWGPAWVSWRIALDYSGWAPLPPGVSLAVGSGLMFNNRRVGANDDFGIPAGWFTFVSQASFLNPNLASYAVEASQVSAMFNRSVPVNNYSTINQRIFNAGPGPAGIASATIAHAAPVAVKPFTGNRRKLENPSQPPTASVSWRDAYPGMSPRQNLVQPAQPLPPVQRIRTPEWPENRSMLPALAATPRWAAPANHEIVVHHEPAARVWAPAPAPIPQAIQPEPARLIAAALTTTSKSGK